MCSENKGLTWSRGISCLLDQRLHKHVCRKMKPHLGTLVRQSTSGSAPDRTRPPVFHHWRVVTGVSALTDGNAVHQASGNRLSGCYQGTGCTRYPRCSEHSIGSRSAALQTAITPHPPSNDSIPTPIPQLCPCIDGNLAVYGIVLLQFLSLTYKYYCTSKLIGPSMSDATS